MPCTNLRFLVVEDHPFQRDMLVRMLLSLGAAAAHEAADGAAALEVLRDATRPIDIVVSDLSMPGMDGLEFVRRLSEDCDPVSLILTSALDRTLLASVANMARAYGVNLLGVIDKPPSAVKLTPLVAKHSAVRAGSMTPATTTGFSAEAVAGAWKRDEFEPWFEPIADLRTGAIVGMTAVPRWRNPGLGILLPEAFLPSLKARGLADNLGWLMLQKSMAECRRWREAGHKLDVTVSLAFDSLTAPELPASVEEMLVAQHLDAGSVVLAVGEDVLRADVPRTLENLARLRVKGFGLLLDDFGSSWMVLEHLALIAFTHLKIKGDFVNGEHGESDLAGIAVGLELATQLRIPAIAGGVVSQDKWTLVRDWDCRFAQGPFISAPLESGAVLPWLATWTGP
jgi:EAL domain-containing protein (putative c-di-GMP-specific phosphodiesterase class I)